MFKDIPLNERLFKMEKDHKFFEAPTYSYSQIVDELYDAVFDDCTIPPEKAEEVLMKTQAITQVGSCKLIRDFEGVDLIIIRVK